MPRCCRGCGAAFGGARRSGCMSGNASLAPEPAAAGAAPLDFGWPRAAAGAATACCPSVPRLPADRESAANEAEPAAKRTAALPRLFAPAVAASAEIVPCHCALAAAAADPGAGTESPGGCPTVRCRSGAGSVDTCCTWADDLGIPACRLPPRPLLALGSRLRQPPRPELLRCRPPRPRLQLRLRWSLPPWRPLRPSLRPRCRLRLLLRASQPPCRPLRSPLRPRCRLRLLRYTGLRLQLPTRRRLVNGDCRRRRDGGVGERCRGVFDRRRRAAVDERCLTAYAGDSAGAGDGDLPAAGLPADAALLSRRLRGRGESGRLRACGEAWRLRGCLSPAARPFGCAAPASCCRALAGFAARVLSAEPLPAAPCKLPG